MSIHKTFLLSSFLISCVIGAQEPTVPVEVSVPVVHEAPEKQTQSFVSKCVRSAKDLVTENPKTSLSLLAAGTVTAGYVAYRRPSVRQSVNEYVKRRSEDLKEVSSNTYYDVLNDIVMPVICEWEELQDEPFTLKDATCVGAAAGITYGLLKVNTHYGITQKLRAKATEKIPLLKEKITQFSHFAYDTYLENKKASHIVLSVTAVLALCYGITKSMQNSSVHYRRLLAEFWSTMDPKQMEKIQSEHYGLVIRADDNPAVLFDSQDLMDMLSESQQQALEKIVMQYTKEAACLKDLVHN